MNTSTIQARNFRSKTSKMVLAVVLTSAMGGLGMTPAFGDEHENRGRDARDRGHYADPDRRDYRAENHRHYRYAQPVYAPPLVYYPPRPSPGITLFFPLDLR